MSAPDRHTYKDWLVLWSGWREPINQFITFGFWVAQKDGSDTMTVATTMGRCGEYRELDVIDTTLERDWQRPVRLTAPDREALRRRALALLYEHLT